MLTDLELYLFDTQGFVVLPGLCTDLVEDIRSEITPALGSDHGNTRSCWNIVDHSPVVRELAVSPKIVKRVHSLINQPMRLIESYAISRAANSRLPLHNGWSEPISEVPDAPTRNLSHTHLHHNGKLYCMFVKALVYLDSVESKEDGAF
ncbi:MAG TPA: hypothetical protein VF163_18745, partial [Micromonosporaceae bacterium]